MYCLDVKAHIDLMTIKELKEIFRKDLSELYSQEEITTFFNWLVEEHLKLKPVDVLLDGQQNISRDIVDVFKTLIQRLKEEEPIQYILGYSEFYGQRFKVCPQVLIPRPETEGLVDWVIKDQGAKSSKHLIDIGTGSGCIAITLQKHLPKSKVTAIDISEKALDVAKYNATLNNVKVKFVKKDVLNIKSLDKTTDVIVSNPPYVRQLEIALMKKNVLSYEPHNALFVENTNPLLFYKSITKLAKKSPKPVVVYFEINQYLVEDLKVMLKNLELNNYFFQKDFRDNMRFLKVLID